MLHFILGFDTLQPAFETEYRDAVDGRVNAVSRSDVTQSPTNCNSSGDLTLLEMNRPIRCK